MPIYEFYCPDCHTIFNFFARSSGVRRQPDCPACGRPKLDKQVSAFATPGKSGEGEEGSDFPVDEQRMERAMTALASEAEHIDEKDPRQAAHMMRRFADMTGVEFNAGMEDALHRLEKGEDPEAIEGEMGNLMEGGEEPFVLTPGRQKARGEGRRLRHDARLYDL